MSTPLAPLSAEEREEVRQWSAFADSPRIRMVGRLLAERDSLERERDAARDHLEQAARREAALAARLEKARAALAGSRLPLAIVEPQHHDQCGRWDPTRGLCNCGLDDLRAALGGD